MKKFIWVAMIVLLITGCSGGVSQKDYEALQEDNEVLAESVKSYETQVSELSKDNEQLKESQMVLEQKEKDASLIAEDFEIGMADTIAAYEGIIAELEAEATLGPTPGASLLIEATNIISALSVNDMATVSLYVDPVQGLRLSPYQYVDEINDVVLTQSEVAAYFSLATVYNWGNYDGSGEPITLNTNDYYYDFIYDADYLAAPYIGQNVSFSVGNTFNNSMSVYTGASYVEFYFSGFDPIYEGIDWSSITLVMELQGSQWYLVGILHGQWTI